MRICVLGNSHAGALKLGWDMLRSHYPGVEMTFFAAQGGAMKGLAVDGDHLVTADETLAARIAYTSGGLSRVDLRSYDAFLVLGLGFSLLPMDARLSMAVVVAALLNRFESTPNRRLSRMVGELTDAPVFVAHEPLLVRAQPWDPKPFSYGRAMDGFERSVDARIHVIRQPAETLLGPWGTRIRYSRGSLRLETQVELKDSLHPKRDRAHMNAQFGELLARDVLSRIAPQGSNVRSNTVAV